MLVPAISKKDELERLFSERIYSEDFFYYSGYALCHEIPEIRAKDGEVQYAIVDSLDAVVGYMAYRVDQATDTAHNFGLMSFDKGNPVIGRNLFEELEKLVRVHHRVEWMMIGGNPVKRHYDKFCKRHNGYVAILHDTCKDPDGNYRDSYIYEIVKKGTDYEQKGAC